MPAITAHAVPTRILKSSHNDQLSIYSRSILHPVIEVVDLVAAAHLPQTGDAGPDAELALVPEFVACQFMPERRAWPNQAHVALEHAPQLRQFVDAELAQEPAHAA